jgi:hypothetical protein
MPVDRGAPAAERIAARRLDLDHFGAEIGEDPGAERGGDVVADLEDFQPDQWPGALRRNLHPALLLLEL